MTVDELLQSHASRRYAVMGILNVTPDSFSDGGVFFAPSDAAAQARRLVQQGADVIDVGGESTRPGAERVSPEQQIERLAHALPAAVDTGALVSVDTTRTRVAEWALAQGATIINDVSAGRDEPELLELAAERDVALILMHMQGTPATMQAQPHYEDVVAEVRAFLAERMEAALQAGVRRERLIVDPGIGFGKTLEHNLQLIAGLDELASLGVPVLLGPSRKRFIGTLTGRSQPAERVHGTVAACLAGRRRGASMFRVHDVAPLVDALKVAAAIEGG